MSSLQGDVPGRLSLPVLCRAGGHTCAACCHGELVPRARLEAALARQARLFASVVGGREPTFFRLLVYEMRVRGLAGLAVALVLLLPLVGELSARWLRRRVACAYLGFEDEGKSRVGCLIHPSRWGGRDVRRWAAFLLWRGLGCAGGDWLCPAARRYEIADWRARRDFLRQASGDSWHEFGRRASAFGEGAARATPPPG